MIRLAEIPGLSGTALGLATPSAAAIAAPAVALGHLGQSIADVAKPFAQVALKVQAAENATRESNLRTSLNEGYSQLTIDLARDPDPQSHLDRVNSYLQQQAAAFQDPDLPPVSRQRLEDHFASFASTARIRTAESAATLSTKRAGLALKNELDGAKRTGNQAQFDDAISTGIDSGLLLPEHVDPLQQQFRSDNLFRDLVKTIDADPDATREQLEDPEFLTRYPDITPESLDKLRRYATQQGNYQRAETWDGILNAALNQGDQRSLLSLDDLEQMAADGDITAEHRASYTRAFLAAEPPAYDPALYEQADSAIGTYDTGTDPTGAGLANLRTLIGTLPLPPEHLKILQGRLNDRANPGNDTTRHRLSGDFSRLTTEYFNQGKFGSWFTYADHDRDPRTADQKTIDLPTYHAAIAAQRSFRDGWEAYLKSAPRDLDPLIAQEEFKKLHQQSREAAPPLDLGVPDAPPATDYRDRVNRSLGIEEPTPQTSTQPGDAGTLPGNLNQYSRTFAEAARLYGIEPADLALAAAKATRQGTAPLDPAAPDFETSLASLAADQPGAKAPTLTAADWGTVEAEWFGEAQPTDPHTIRLGLGVLRDAWNVSQFGAPLPSQPASASALLLPPRQ